VSDTSPSPDPCTVTDADPVPARFSCRDTLTLPASNDIVTELLPVRSPAVIATRRVPGKFCPTRHRTDVSDSHSVPSHPVCPIRPRAVNAPKPRLDPCTVTDAVPVLPRLVRRITLRLRISSEYASDILPTHSPVVNVDRRVSLDPCPTRHRTDVSDSHSVPSHPVCPMCPIAVSDTSPSPDPCTVTDADPVPARFCCRDTLTLPASNDIATELLPLRSPAVIATRRVPGTPCPTRHRTDVSDSHSVPSHPVCPIRPIAVSDTSPSPDPCIVTDADPVPARFDFRVALKLTTSVEYMALAVPSLSLAVIAIRRVPWIPRPTRHPTDVSDSHSVPSHPVCPIRPIAVSDTSPSPDPCTVTDADPVLALLLRNIELKLPTSIEYASDMLPTFKATVIETGPDV
jgi:hypothetical protein